jgi:hypothetical protein
MVAVHWNLPTCGYDELPETASPVTECDCPRSYGRAGSALLYGYRDFGPAVMATPERGILRFVRMSAYEVDDLRDGAAAD